MAKLSARRVAAITEPGLYGDGHGLWLQVGPTGGKSWAFRYQLRRRARQMGLGPVDLVPLAEARQKAHEARRLLFEGIDPLDHRINERQPAPAAITFRRCASATSLLTRPPGATLSTGRSGRALSRPTPIRYSAI